ncbi:MAG: hypothetical protein QXG01_06755, partial [Candidatus Bathyarchaeia archaeon]
MNPLDQTVKEKLIDECFKIAEDNKIVASCVYGSRLCGYAREDSDYDVLLIIEDYPDSLRYHTRSLNKVAASVLTVDKNIFEIDVKKGSLGEFISGRLLTPYLPILNEAYLRAMEIENKKRIVREEIEDLILEFGESARGLIIKPKYFMLSRMRKRAKVYPTIKYSYSNLFRKDLKEKNLKKIMEGFLEALKELEKEGVLKIEDETIKIGNKFIDLIIRYKVTEKVVNIVEKSQRTLYSYLTQGMIGIVDPDALARELALKLRREILRPYVSVEIDDPKDCLFLKTSTGLVSLNEKASITELVNKLKPNARITISPLANVLNEVYLITLDGEKLIAKKFTDWHDFKWFMLNLIAIGTKVFSVSGKERLANEYGMNHFLHEKDVLVPRIIHVSFPEKLLLKEYITGISLEELIKKVHLLDELSEENEKIAFDFGKTMGKIHELDVSLGDTKPDNFILSSSKEVWILDLEQSKKMGDKAWDIAEFLYYSGHYGFSLSKGFSEFLECFRQGYS